MKEFLAQHSYIIIWVLALIIVGSMATLIVQLNGITTGTLSNPTAPSGAGAGASSPGAPLAPPAPAITLTIVKSPKGNSLFVQWQNLPGNTTELDIFREKTDSTSTWSLWQKVSLTPDELANGSANLDLSSAGGGYSYYVQAASDNGDSSGGGDGSTILWTSSSTVPIVTTSTPSGPGDNGPGSPSGNTPPSNPSSTSPENPTSTAPGTPSSTNPVSGGSPSSTSPSSPSSSAPTGNPYYNPQVQIEGYGTAPGSFWVQHLNQSIQLGWQNLPTGIDSIVVARSASSTGPWNTIITQQNPGTTGSYSLQLVDNSLNDPYYYQMTAFNGTTTVATYGPIYLAGQ